MIDINIYLNLFKKKQIQLKIFIFSSNLKNSEILTNLFYFIFLPLQYTYNILFKLGLIIHFK